MNPNNPSYLICRKCANHYEPPVNSRIESCGHCQTPVWRAYSSPADAVALCPRCALELLNADPDPMICGPSGEQMRDITRVLRTLEEGQ